jgi:hypothetical protein
MATACRAKVERAVRMPGIVHGAVLYVKKTSMLFNAGIVAIPETFSSVEREPGSMAMRSRKYEPGTDDTGEAE